MTTTGITHSVSHNSEETYNTYLEAYRALHPCDQGDLRGCAYEHLKHQGFTEIGSSDVSCQVYEWFKEYRSFSPLVLKVLTDHYL